MSDQADARRMQFLGLLAESQDSFDLETIAARLGCDTRTIRRDIDSLQQLLRAVNGLELRRGRVVATRPGYSPGYFTGQMEVRKNAKQAIARHIVSTLPDGAAIALTAGSTPYAVACEIRRAAVESDSPHDLIVFTNSIPALLELVAGGVSAGVLGEIYNSEDCALHTSDFRSAFQPGLAIIGASGILPGTGAVAGVLDVFSHRAEEAAFMKQVLAGVPEVIVAVDSSKLGKRHPWNFGAQALLGKKVRLVTDAVSAEQRHQLDALQDLLAARATQFTYECVQAQQSPTVSNG